MSKDHTVRLTNAQLAGTDLHPFDRFAANWFRAYVWGCCTEHTEPVPHLESFTLWYNVPESDPLSLWRIGAVLTYPDIPLRTQTGALRHLAWVLNSKLGCETYVRSRVKLDDHPYLRIDKFLAHPMREAIQTRFEAVGAPQTPIKDDSARTAARAPHGA